MAFSPVLGNPKPQVMDENGDPYVGLRYFFYNAGGSTKQDTQTNSTGAVDNTNPIVFDAEGYPTGNVMIYGANNLGYKVVCAPPGTDDPPAAPLWTINNIYPGVTVDGEWINPLPATYISANSFSVTGDQTEEYQEGRRVWLEDEASAANNRFGTILTSAFTTLTTLTLSDIVDTTNTPSTLHADMDTAYLSILSADIFSLPSFSSTASAIKRQITDVLSSLPRFLDYIPLSLHAAIKDGTTTTDLTAYFDTAKAETNVLVFEPGTFVGNYVIHQDGFSIIGAGSKLVTLKAPASSNINVIELGELALGNSATPFKNAMVTGITVDGNKANTVTPLDDLTGWGIGLTAYSLSFFDDVRVKDCHNGFGVFINSNYNTATLYVENCANSTFGTAGVDFNSSNYCIFDIITEACDSGLRLLSNCYGNQIRSANFNSVRYGVVLANQLTNWGNIANNFDITVRGGCSIAAVSIGAEQYANVINASIYQVDAIGMRLSSQGANVVIGSDSNPYTCILEHTSSPSNEPITGGSYLTYWVAGGSSTNNWVDARDYRTENVSRSNVINLNTYECQTQGLICYGHNNIINHNSYRDGRAGAVGAVYAIDIYGDYNQITATIEDTITAQVRGINIRAGAVENEIIGMSFNQLILTPVTDSGTRSFFNAGDGQGADLASASAVNLSFKGKVYAVTGTTQIDSINGRFNRIFTLTFSTNIAIGSAGNIKLAGAATFNATADDTLTLHYDGTNCIEISRSVN